MSLSKVFHYLNFFGTANPPYGLVDVVQLLNASSKALFSSVAGGLVSLYEFDIVIPPNWAFVPTSVYLVNDGAGQLNYLTVYNVKEGIYRRLLS